MQTTPSTHPINAAIQPEIASKSITTTTPLELLARTFSNYAAPIETIKTYPVPPWWSPPFRIEINGDKKMAKAKHAAMQEEQHTLCIYTDGSGSDRHVGAAADIAASRLFLPSFYLAPLLTGNPPDTPCPSDSVNNSPTHMADSSFSFVILRRILIAVIVSRGPSERLPGCRRCPRRHSAGPRLFPKVHFHVLEYPMGIPEGFMRVVGIFF